MARVARVARACLATPASLVVPPACGELPHTTKHPYLWSNPHIALRE